VLGLVWCKGSRPKEDGMEILNDMVRRVLARLWVLRLCSRNGVTSLARVETWKTLTTRRGTCQHCDT